ncbi:MAG: TonB-dependent receptor [Bryobacterales bacterium]|nr:TonB-dependent receptor [Bryobacterales bacterium]
MRPVRIASSIALLFLGTLSAQEFRATISGTVTDASGATVPNVQLTAVSVDRQVEYRAVTNEAGRYVTPFLPAGAYRLRVEKDGFKPILREGITVSGVDRVNLDIKLEVGSTTDRITVTADTPLLQTETAVRSGTIGSKMITDIPVSGRNMFQFQYSLPGVTKTSNYWGNYELYAFGNINSVSINGGRSGENEILLDGITTTRGNRSASFAPALQAIEEVNIVTNTYDAQYGRVGGGTTSINLRTGTNTIHGELFEFFKNSKLISNGYSRNSAGVRKPAYKNNTYGFRLDGPVYIPKLVDGRNRLFWLLSLEGLRERNPQTQLWTLPTAEQRNGDFSRLQNNAGQQIGIFDPLSGNPRQQFPGNVIPRTRLNPVATTTLGFFPLPNRQSEGLDGQNNYLFVNSSRNEYDQWLGKMDYAVSDRSRLSWRYGQTPWENFARVQWGTNAAEPSTEAPSTRISRNWGADWTFTLNPTTVFNLRGGLARYEGFSGNVFGRGFDPVQLGFPNSIVSQFDVRQYPRFNFTGNNYSSLGSTRTANYETQDTYSLQPNMTMIRGKQTWKFGAELRRYNSNTHNPGASSGTFNFGRNWTQRNPQQADALSGNEIATFLTGAVTSGNVEKNIWPAYRNSYGALFFQNDWKITRTVTLNLGVRWDYEGPIVERFNRQVRGFAFDQASPLQSQVQGLTLRGGLLYAGTSGAAREAFLRDRNNWQPRVGIAWQFLPGWVMRGGYGLSYLGQNAAGPDTGFSQPTTVIASVDNNITPASFINDPFPTSLYPNGLLKPIGSSQGLTTNLGQAVAAQYLNRPLPYSQQFSFGLQRTLFNSWLVDASYSGNLTEKLPLNIGQNFIPGSELTRLPVAERPAYFNAAQPNPMRGLLPGSGLNGNTLPRSTLLNAFPHFSQVTITNVPIGKQNFHSLQVKASRRFANGFSSQLSYTWSKTLESMNLLNNQDADLSNLLNTPLEQRLQQWDIPHTFTGIVTYELPFGKGKRWGTNLGGAGQAVLGGWSLNVMYIARSGVPFDFPNAAPLQARSAALTKEQRDERARAAGRDSFNPFFDKYYDTTLFPRAAQTPFTLRDFPTRFPDVRSPYMQSWEISAYKEFKFFERVRWQIRADFQNAFDYAYFGAQASNNVTDPRFGQLNPAQNNATRQAVLVMKVLF